MAWEEYGFTAFTLAYSPRVRWQARHIATLVETYARYLRPRHYLEQFHIGWSAEATATGRVIYHVLIVTTGTVVPAPDRRWPRSRRLAWPHGPVESMRSLTKVADLEAVLRQMAEPLVHPLPRGARRYGTSVGGLGRRYTAAAVRWRKLPRYVREQTTVRDRVVKVRGGYEVYTFTPEDEAHATRPVFVPTPYRNVWSEEGRAERYAELRALIAARYEARTKSWAQSTTAPPPVGSREWYRGPRSAPDPR